MKKKYEKPSMKVVELKHRTMILSGSPNGIPGYDDDYGYMPKLGKDDMNHLA